MLQIRCKNNGVTKSFPEGSSLLDVYEEFANEINLPYPVISAKVNNASQGLKFRLYQNRDVEFLDARMGSGFRVYVRSLCFVLYKATQDLFPGSKLFIEHSLSRGYYCNFKKKNNGYILNVASIAGFFSGPLMATYYATKNYVVSLTGAIYEELQRSHSNVKISALCPGPVDTEFNDVAHVKFSAEPLDSKTVAQEAIDGLLQGKLYIIPSSKMKCLKLVKRLLPDKTITHFCYTFQKKKK